MAAQLSLVPKPTCQTVGGEKVLNDDWEQDSEGMLSAFDEIPQEKQEKGQQIAHNVKVCHQKATKAWMEHAQVLKLSHSLSCQVPDGLGAQTGPRWAECLDSCFVRGLGKFLYCSPMSNIVFVGAAANQATYGESKHGIPAKKPETVVYKHAPKGFPMNLSELKQLFKYIMNEFMSHQDCNTVPKLQHDVMQAILQEKEYCTWGLCMTQEEWDMVPGVEVPFRLTHIDEENQVVLCVVKAPSTDKPFDVEELVQYVHYSAYPQ
ncbi:hypothetical protein C0993_012208 [Termitomyces sp. T159_Od127]|nr:hypothetical protein C0993_012208 [Termitomyces sp. T159_Od127]